jgi:hypothetical protein
MIKENTEIVENFAFEGAMTPLQAVGLCLLMAGLFAWLLWRERYATGMFWATAFWVMRTVALAVVLWMLLGPTFLIRERTTIPQTVALLVDGSESMDVVDPMSTAELMRWTLAASSTSSGRQPVLTACDRAEVALRMALAACERATAAADQHRSVETVRKHVLEVEVAVKRVDQHLSMMNDDLRRRDSSLAARARRIEAAIQGPVPKALSRLFDALEEDAVAASAEISLPLDSLQTALTTGQRRLANLARDVADQLAANPPKEMDPGETSRMSRKDMVARSLDQLETQKLEELESTVRIKRLRIDSLVTPVTTNRSWSASLAQHAAGPRYTTKDAEKGEVVYGPLTNLTAALQQLGRDAPTEAISTAILWSDGGHNAPDTLEPQDVAAGLVGLPVHVVPTGSSEPLRDVLLHRLAAPTAVIVNDLVVIEAIVTAFQCKGESTEVTLRRDGEVIEQQRIEFSGNRIDHRLRFNVAADELGRHEFELVVEPLPDEASTTNNVALAQVEVIKDNTRVLLADQMAQYEYRFLWMLFRRDERVTLDRFLVLPQLTATGSLESTQRLPGDVDGWGRYDVVVLGDMNPDQLDVQSQRALDEYVRVRGGNLVVIAGRRHMPQDFAGQPLVDLLPVQRGSPPNAEDGYTLSVTSEGLSHNAVLIKDSPADAEETWHELYSRKPLYYISDYCRPKPGAQTLINATPREGVGWSEDDRQPAFLCWHQVGAGRVVYLSAPSTYVLRFRHGDVLHYRFWGQLVRWMTAAERSGGSKFVRLQTDKTRYEFGDAATVLVRLTDDANNPVRGGAVGAVATNSEGTKTSIELTPDDRVPGRYIGQFDGLAPGAYRIEPTGDDVQRLLAGTEASDGTTAVISVFASQNIEMLDTKGNRALLQQVAEVTGGQVVPPTAVDEILTLTAQSPRINENVERQPLWNRWAFLWIVAGCLSVEWIARKRMGLL